MTRSVSPAELEQRLRAIGAERYHDRHPFHKLLHGGELSRGQVQAWALNRYYYQCSIPRKDAALMARLEDREIRRVWRSRIIDHDGDLDPKPGCEGGIERWLVHTDGLGLDRNYVMSTKGILPATRFAVEAYVRFVYERPVLEGIASSLTELFAPAIHRERIAGMLENYSYVDDGMMVYFRQRLEEAPKDAEFGLDYVKRNALAAEQQEAVLAALIFKCDLLWAQLDALYLAYVAPGHIPPGAFVPAAGDV